MDVVNRMLHSERKILDKQSNEIKKQEIKKF